MREALKALSEARHRKTWRGRDLKRLVPIPWTTHDVLAELSNGWTIEAIARDDWWLEGLLMGHCLGHENGPGSGVFVSLRDDKRIPHATIHQQSWGPAMVIGRCNQTPPDKYLALVYEWNPESRPQRGWGEDTDEQYHEGLVLTDMDYRDLPTGEQWHDAAYFEKRAVA